MNFLNCRLLLGFTVLFFCIAPKAQSQHYKLKQSSSMMGMKTESTIYVKGMRKRTEGAAMMGQTQLVTIEQCDLQRTITINDKKKLYFIEPFSKPSDEVIDDDVKVAPKAKPAVVKGKDSAGGVITMWYNILDTGERKTMYGFTARHIWTTQKLKPSADACMMKDSFIIKTDGWYIDLPQFNCPVHYNVQRPATPTNYQKPSCTDRFVTHRSGKGKLGFPLIEKRTMIMGGQQSTEFTTNLETVELSTANLDSMLFEIPPGYKQAATADELQEKFDPMAMAKEYMDKEKQKPDNSNLANEEMTGGIRIGVLEPTGDENLKSQGADLQQYIVSILSGGNIRSVAVSSDDDARTKKCDYVLHTSFDRYKQASKIGGLLKAVKNADPNAASSFNIDAGMVLIKLADGSTKLTEKMSGKYEGKPDQVAKMPLQEGVGKLMGDLR